MKQLLFASLIFISIPSFCAESLSQQQSQSQPDEQGIIDIISEYSESKVVQEWITNFYSKLDDESKKRLVQCIEAKLNYYKAYLRSINDQILSHISNSQEGNTAEFYNEESDEKIDKEDLSDIDFKILFEKDKKKLKQAEEEKNKICEALTKDATTKTALDALEKIAKNDFNLKLSEPDFWNYSYKIFLMAINKVS